MPIPLSKADMCPYTYVTRTQEQNLAKSLSDSTTIGNYYNNLWTITNVGNSYPANSRFNLAGTYNDSTLSFRVSIFKI